LRKAVEIAYRLGANVIAAHGTHALGPVEHRQRAVIVWGLGNLAFACDCTEEKDALILLVTVKPNTVVRAAVVPLQAGINGRPAEPAADATAIFDLLTAIGSTSLQPNGASADF
jgi:poly-gamma-glutamate synthesis protein (capsule biosynthesis protein)